MIDSVVSAPSVSSTPRMHMSGLSIVAGWLVALGMAWLFYLLGLAVGFSAFDVSDTTATAKGVGIGTTIWVVLTWVVSLFLGGMFASWMDGRPDQTIGTLHGVAVWGLAMSATALLAAAGASNILQGGASLLQGTATAGSIAAQRDGGPTRSDTPIGHATGLLAAQINRAVAQGEGPTNRASVSPISSSTVATPSTSSPSSSAAAASGSDGRSPGSRSLNAETSSAVASDLLRGNADDAKARLIADTGIQPAEADSVMQGLSAQVEKYKAQLKQTAEEVRRYTAAAIWAVFLGSLLALIAAALGGWAGAGHIHRVHDTIVEPLREAHTGR
jgi:hypothetical protein